jgi:hypothetical protein
MDEIHREREEMTTRRAALEKSVSDAIDAEQASSRSVTSLERELDERLAAGVIRRLLMRSEAEIRSDLSRERARRDDEVRRVREHRLALDDPERCQRERDLAALHEKLEAALRSHDRAAAPSR